MTPTEKHRETAREVFRDYLKRIEYDRRPCFEHDELIQELFATALTKAEREGMGAERNRCADLLAAVTSVFRRCEIENDWTALIETLSAAILSEAGKDE